MIDLSGIITNGNYAFAGHPMRANAPPEISLTGATEIRGGNFVLARITTNGFTLTLTGGNFAGLRTRVNPQAPWTKRDSFVWQEKKELPKAVSVLDSIRKEAGEDGVKAWNFAVNLFMANPTITQIAWEAEQAAWAAKTGLYAGRPGKINMLLPANSLLRIIESFWPGKGFLDIRNDIIAQNAATWAGEPTQIMGTFD